MTTEIKIVEHIPWQHIIIVGLRDTSSGISTYDYTTIVFDQIKHWCEQNCKNQWMLSTNPVTCNLFAVPQVDVPTTNKYSSSKIELKKGILVAFEDEQEAVAFKLQFSDS